MGPEAALWAWLRKGLAGVGPHDVHRIETSTELGYPDVEGCIAGACFLVELKVAHYVRKRDATFALDHYTSKQAYALHKRWKAGGRSWLLVRVPWPEGQRHYLVAGREALIVHDERLKLSRGFLEAVSWPGLEDGSAMAKSLWQGISGPIV